MVYPVNMTNSTGTTARSDGCSCPPRDGTTLSLRQNPVVIGAYYLSCTGCGYEQPRPVTWRDQIFGVGIIPVRAA